MAIAFAWLMGWPQQTSVCLCVIHTSNTYTPNKHPPFSFWVVTLCPHYKANWAIFIIKCSLWDLRLCQRFPWLNQNQKCSSVHTFSMRVKTSSGLFFCTLGIHLHTPAQIETGKQEEQLRKEVGQELVAAGLEWAPYLLMQKKPLASCFTGC